MLACVRQFTRAYSTSAKPSMALLSKLRKEIEGVPMMRVMEALVQNNYEYDRALKWLKDCESIEGLKKAQKVSARVAKEGLVAAYIPRWGGCLLELNTETDFVARSPVVQQLCFDITRSLAHHYLHQEQCKTKSGDKAIRILDANDMQQIPLLAFDLTIETNDHDNSQGPFAKGDRYVQQGITDAIGKLGENISLRRCAIAIHTPENNDQSVTGGYVHGTDPLLAGKYMGRLGALVTLQSVSSESLSISAVDEIETGLNVRSFAKQIARLVVGFNPVDKQALLDTTFPYRNPIVDRLRQQTNEPAEAQISVGDALKASALQVADFIRYELGEGIDKQEVNFAEEVRRQLGN